LTKTGNSVPAASSRHPGIRARVRDESQRQLGEIEELVARLQLVTQQLQLPFRSTSELASHKPVRREQALVGDCADSEAS
jgi:hypothetical protein